MSEPLTEPLSEPLTEWFCDSCGGTITDPERGIVVARYDDASRYCDFRLVHKTFAGTDRHCDPGSLSAYKVNLTLSRLLGPGGVAYLLALLSPGPLMGGAGLRIADINEYVDLFRRVQTPYYEEARRRFDDSEVRAALGDATEEYPYRPEVLERIASGDIG